MRMNISNIILWRSKQIVSIYTITTLILGIVKERNQINTRIIKDKTK